MPKRVFWPAALITMGLIFLASNLRLLPPQFWNLWPLILIIVGLGGLVTSDREEWMVSDKAASRSNVKSAAKPAAKKSSAAKKSKKR